MSDKSNRFVWWDGKHGSAYCDGVTVELRASPAVPGLDVAEINFAPRVGMHEVRVDGAYRVLDADEIGRVHELLETMSTGAHAALAKA